MQQQWIGGEFWYLLPGLETVGGGCCIDDKGTSSSSEANSDKKM